MKKRPKEQPRKIKRLMVVFGVLAAFVFMPGGGEAATFSCSSDSSPSPVACLIGAMAAANANGEVNTISLDGSTFTLNAVDNTSENPHGYPSGPNGLPSVTSKMTIVGNGATIIERDPSATVKFRIFHVSSGGELTLDGVTVRNGLLPDDANIGSHGGGIQNWGRLNVINSTVTNNRAGNTGDLYGGVGGGISSAGHLTVTNSAISYNRAGDGTGASSQGGAGGGIQAICELLPFPSGSLILVNSTIKNNSAGNGNMTGGLGGQGGGVHFIGCKKSGADPILTGTLDITGSTFENNNAGKGFIGGSGGGLLIGGATQASIFNSTFYANKAGGYYGDGTVGGGGGGAIIVNGVGNMVDISHSTLVSNSPGLVYPGSSTLNGKGGGLFVGDVSEPTQRNVVNIRSSLFAGNNFLHPFGGLLFRDCFYSNSEIVDLGYNIDELTSCGFSAASNSLPGTGAMTSGSLQENGGPTRTIALCTGNGTPSAGCTGPSPALDAVPVGMNGCGAAPFGADQRGVERPKDGNRDGIAKCDIGAFESAYATTAAIAASSGSSAFGDTVTFTATVTDGFPDVPSGTVAFTINGVPMSGCEAVALAANGKAVCSTSALAAGMHGIIARYSGDSLFEHSSSPLLAHTVYFKVTPSAGPGGSLSPAPPQAVSMGDTKTFSVALDSGYVVSGVTGCGAYLTGAGTIVTGPVTENCSVAVTFSNGPVNGLCGMLSGQAFTAAPPLTYLCAAGIPSVISGSGPWSWSCEGGNGGSTASCSASNQPWSVTPSAGTGGTISPDTVRPVFSWGTTSFTVTALPSYRIQSVTGCNGSLSGTTYTTGPITADCTVTAQFLDTGNLPAPGNALAFDGSNDYVTIADADTLDLTTNYTIEAWIKPNEFKWLGGIVSKYTIWGAGGYTLRMGMNGNFSGVNFDGMETAQGALQPGVWQHIAAVNDNGTRHVYVNGVEIPLSGSPIATAANSGPVVIGMDWDGRFFNGAIDEVRIWNTARTQSEIRSGMMTVPENSPGLTASYRFDQGTAGGDNTGVTTLYDRTGNRLDGTLTNFGLNEPTSNWIASGAALWHTLTLAISGPGSVHGSSLLGQSYACAVPACPPVSFVEGDRIDLTATGSNSTFGGWSGACSGSANPCQIILDSDKSITATFTPDPATVRIDGDPSSYYSIATALAAPAGNATVRATASVFTGNVVMTNPVTILIKGGYSDTNFSSQTGYSTISGSLTVSSGMLVIDRLSIAP